MLLRVLSSPRVYLLFSFTLSTFSYDIYVREISAPDLLYSSLSTYYMVSMLHFSDFTNNKDMWFSASCPGTPGAPLVGRTHHRFVRRHRLVWGVGNALG